MAKLNLIRVPMGCIEDEETGDRENIIVKSPLPTSIVDAIIGGLMILSGVGYLTVKAFVKGTDAHYKAMFDASDKLGIAEKDETD